MDSEQIKRIIAALSVMALLVYAYFEFLLGPLQKSQADATNGIASLAPQIADAKKQIARTAALENQAPQATAFLTDIRKSIPDGAPIAWFPPRMTEFFKNRGIDKCTTHLVSDSADSMPGFHRMVWSIDIPKVEFVPLGLAISNLENNEPLLNVLNVTIDATREDAQYQHATLVLATRVKS